MEKLEKQKEEKEDQLELNVDKFSLASHSHAVLKKRLVLCFLVKFCYLGYLYYIEQVICFESKASIFSSISA